MDALKGFLQGKWLGHPLHPALVHIPTALWPAALLFDLLSRTGAGGPVPFQIAYYALLVGLLVALVAAVAGLADWADIKPDKPAKKLGLIHMVLNLTVAGLMALNVYLRAQLPPNTDPVPWTLIALTLLANLILMVSGYLGGRMVYNYGISVARHAKDKLRQRAAAAGANLPASVPGLKG
jgi:uncharacterized membrane protein